MGEIDIEEMDVDGTIFGFPASWKIARFDEWKQFSQVSRYGISGPDILALDGEELWIMEMKDYTYPGAQQPDDLAEVVARKAAGALAVLFALARSDSSGGAVEFAKACQGAQRIHLVLHVQPKSGGRGEDQVKTALMPLRQKIKRARKALGLQRDWVTSNLVQTPGQPWTARRNPAERSRHEDR